jgi:hypothetical protein
MVALKAQYRQEKQGHVKTEQKSAMAQPVSCAILHASFSHAALPGAFVHVLLLGTMLRPQRLLRTVRNSCQISEPKIAPQLSSTQTRPLVRLSVREPDTVRRLKVAEPGRSHSVRSVMEVELGRNESSAFSSFNKDRLLARFTPDASMLRSPVRFSAWSRRTRAFMYGSQRDGRRTCLN